MRRRCEWHSLGPGVAWVLGRAARGRAGAAWVHRPARYERAVGAAALLRSTDDPGARGSGALSAHTAVPARAPARPPSQPPPPLLSRASHRNHISPLTLSPFPIPTLFYVHSSRYPLPVTLSQ
ncbi:hypothetical protein R5R35_001608 [Gryllus longicercus]|uniref:Uncharacterized protein n=1 Tax=Gryllus longicercus TaxID=2509291 RepID=A0AAN9YZV7_9ORTH